MFKFITSKPLWVNITVGVGSLAILIFIFFISLGFITGHGQYDKVPDITGQNVYAAINTLESKGFRVEVSDSIFTTSLPALVISKQIPEGEAMVKHGRTIYLTVNRSVPPKIEMPSLIGFSYKSAKMYLESMGLKMGDTTYRPDFARNSVLEQLFNKEPIKPGTQVPVGSSISFVLGAGLSDSAMNVPDVVGLTLQQAKSKLSLMNLEVGSIIAEGTVTDSLNAFVIKQNPPIYSGATAAIAGQRLINTIKQGTTLDLYISTSAPVKDSTNTYPQQ